MSAAPAPSAAPVPPAGAQEAPMDSAGTPDPSGAELVGRAFKAAMGAVRRLRGRDTHRPGAISYAQYGLLFGLGEHGRLSARELAETADLSAATVTQMLDSLAASGLVDRIRSEDDKRIVLTSLTERGRAVIEQRRASLEPRWRAALADFSDQELRTTAAVLDRLRELFDEFAAYSIEDTLPAASAGHAPADPTGAVPAAPAQR
jgi:DNA-binding MarR family transcriptional regulator